MHVASNLGVARIDRVVAAEDDDGPLVGAQLDAPVAGSSVGAHAVQIEGWAAGRASPARQILVLYGGRPVLTLPVALPRADVGEAFPGVRWARSSGFAGTLGTLRVPTEYVLDLRVVFEDGQSAPLALVHGARRPLPASRTSGIQPLLLTTLGRSGSTWLTWLLDCHPEIFCYRPFEADTRAGSYWMDIFERLSDPTSAFRPLLRDGPVYGEWWLGEQAVNARLIGDPELERWLTLESVYDLADLFAGRIQALYDRMARDAGTLAPRLFIEKHSPGLHSTDLLLEVFSGGREVVLVRDLRDTFCSIVAFKERPGNQGFGWGGVSSDEDQVSWLRMAGEALLARWRARAGEAWLVRYEELVLDPLGTLGPLLDYLGVDSGLAELTLARATEHPHEGARPHMTAPDPKASVGRWRRDLDDRFQDLCGRELGPLMDAFGYPAEGY